MSPAELRRFALEHRVRFVSKAQSRLMRWADRAVRLIGNRRFMDGYWTTIGRTIYYPTTIDDPYDRPTTIEHEFVHVRQWERYGLWFSVSYLLFPVPLGLAWFRWRWEREAYLVQLECAADPRREIDRIVDSLWTGYGWPWPRAWMQQWFMRHLQTRHNGPQSPPQRR